MTSANFLIAVTPLVLLLVVLHSGRYPGERVVGRIRKLAGEVTRPRVVVSPPALRIEPRPSIRGGRLIAESRAGRGPPCI